MREALKHINQAVKSLQKLEEIFGPSKRTAGGVLEDIGEWLVNDENLYCHHLTESVLILHEDNRGREACKHIEFGRDKWYEFKRFNIMGSDVDGLAYSLKALAEFSRNDLEDCILGLQQAIQILEEEMNNE